MQATEGFDHIGLTVSQLEQSTAFFVNGLGWRLLGRNSDYPAAFVSDGHMMIALWQAKTDKPVAFDRKNNVGLHHLAIRVSSFEQLDNLYQRIKTMPGVVIEFAPEPAYGGPAKHMMVREPSGNRLEFKHSPN
ncbi:VOC family protein [Neptunicella marina]|uniref:VOC family protein n=2 Tax=Neptunicella marina TaxID=2125989 RepID=A0A8J6IV01_9ALTE|nr:VOC family protein [Neptunicella marina]